MGTDVKANGNIIACKAGSGKSIACMPDVCWTPPETIVTPTGVPIPYPNTGSVADMTDGTKDVKIKGDEVCLEDSSSFKESKGDEAGSASLKGLITMENTGSCYFVAWSMDVKFEGKGVDRSLDMMTHNHMSKMIGNTPPNPYMDS